MMQTHTEGETALRKISVREFLQYAEGSVTVFDVSKKDAEREIRGAIRYLPKKLIASDTLVLPVDHHRPLVVYGEPEDAGILSRVARRLEGQGFLDVRVLDEGMGIYQQQGGRTQEASVEQPVV